MTDIHARPPLLLFMKAVTKKQIWIPGYTKRDGTPVAGHMHWVNVSVDHDEHKAVAGKGNYTEQQAHKKLSKKDWFNAMPHDHKVAHILKEATAIQHKASMLSRANSLKKKILAGEKPINAEWKAFHSLPQAKQQEWVQDFHQAGKAAHFSEGYGKYLASAPKEAPEAAQEAPKEPPKVVAAKEEAKPAEPAPEPKKEEPKAEPETVDWFEALYGKEAAASMHTAADLAQPSAPAPKVTKEALGDALDGAKSKAQATLEKWQAKQYKPNKTQVELHGDGPKGDPFMSIGAINAGKKQKAIAAAQDEVNGIAKLQSMLSSEDGAKKLTGIVNSTMTEAKSAFEKDTLSIPVKSAEAAFEFLILDKLGIKPPKGSYTSHPISQALLSAMKGEKAAEPKPEPSPEPSTGAKLGAENDAKAAVLDKIEAAKAKLPSDHHITPGMKKKLDGIAHALITGDEKSILSHGYQSHTYGKQAAKLANEALAAMGSKHTVMPGQKMGEHAGLKDEDAGSAPADKSADAEQAQKIWAENSPAIIARYEQKWPHYTKEQVVSALEMWAETNPKGFINGVNHAHMRADKPEAAAATTDNGPKEGDTKEGADGTLVLKDGHWVKQGEQAAAAPAGGLAMPEFAEGKTKAGVKAYYEKVAQKIIDHANAGNVSVLEGMPNPETGNTWKGKTANSKKILELHAAALAHAKGEAPAFESAPADIPDDAPKAKTEPAAPADLSSGFTQAANVLKEWADKGNTDELAKMATVEVTTGSEDMQKLKDYAAALYEFKTGKKAEGVTAMPTPPKPDTTDMSDIHKDAATAIESLLTTGSAVGHVGGQVSNLQDYFGAFDYPGNTLDDKKIAQYAKVALASLGEEAKHSGAETAAAPAPTAEPESKKYPAGVNKSLADDAHVAADKGDKATLNDIFQYAKEQGLANTALYVADLIDKLPAAVPVKPESNFTGAVNGIEQAYKDKDPNAEVLQNWAKYDAKGDAQFQVVVDYAKQVLQAIGGTVADSGPKEGDTKQGADGMLVFKDGRWHKQGGDEPKATDPKELVKKVASVAKPKFEGKNSVKMNASVKALQEIAMKEGAAGLDAVVYDSKPTGIKVVIKAGPQHWAIPKDPSMGGSPNGQKLKDYALALKAAMAGTAGAGDAAPEPKKAAPKVTGSTATTTESVDGWKQVGPQGGYNPGGTYEDPSGQKWYVKFPAGGEKIAKNELLATKLYALAGVDVPDVKLINQGGKIGLASKIVDGAVANKSALLEGKAKGLLQGFGADAWLANWDTVGNNPAAGKGFDNILIKPDGSAVRIDAGGALLYGGAGGKKQKFEDNVVELKTMLDSSINPNTAAVFGKMSPADIAASVAKVAAIPDSHIESLVQTYGPGSQAEKDRLAAKLIARKENMIAQYPSAAKAAAPKTTKSGKTIDPNDTSWVDLKPSQKIVESGVSQWGVQFAKIENPPAGFNAEKLPQPYPYTASKSAHVNAANTADIQKLFDNAKAGKTAEAVEKTQFEQISKETGEKTGKMLDIANHPSKVYLQEYATQLAAEVKAQTSPTYEMQTRGSATGSYSDIAKRIASKVKTIAYEQFQGWKDKAADYMVLNKTEADGIPKPEPGMFHDMEKGTKEFNDFKKASDNNYNKLTSDEKSACKAYTGAAYRKWNEALRMGQVDSEHFAGSADMRAAFAKAAVELPEGIILHRGIGVGGDTYKSVIGAVIQDGSFQSSSFGGTAAFSGKESQLRLHVTKGVKAMMAATFSSHSEREIILHPNTRYVVMGVKYENGQNHVDVLVLPHEE
jgi:hypothetical protein